jgi:DNA-binding CsgD family transcriptional regulator
MTREEKVKKAQKLRADDLTYEAIGERLGASLATAYRWLNPEYEERQRAVSRAWKRRTAEPCEKCGELKDYTNDSVLCGRCGYEAIYGERNEEILAMWNKGEPGWFIGEQLGMSETAVLSWINNQRLRKGEDIPLRRARDRDRWDEIASLWCEGLTQREIGERLGLTGRDIGGRVQNMRLAGIDLPRRTKAAA